MNSQQDTNCGSVYRFAIYSVNQEQKCKTQDVPSGASSVSSTQNKKHFCDHAELQGFQVMVAHVHTLGKYVEHIYVCGQEF
jgi:peptide methionine sulfoxide reductase MsrA